MKKILPEYFCEENIKIWEDDKTKYIFDTNVLLSFYLLNDKSIKEIFLLLEGKNVLNKLWIPNHVAEEYLIERSKVILRLVKSYENKINNLSEAKKFSDDNPPFLSDNLKKDLDITISKVLKELEQEKNKFSDLIKTKNDIIFKKINEIFKDKIGSEFSVNEILSILSEGEKRNNFEIPPGNKDKNKNQNKFGDLIIWKQILAYAEKGDFNIVFVTNETKEDWWIYLENKNNKIPHPWLIKEFKEKLKNRVFIISNFDNFVKNINEISKKKISKSTLNDIKDSQEYISFSGIEGYSRLGVLSKGYSGYGAFENVNAGIGSSVLIGDSPFIEKGTRAVSFSKDSLSHNGIYIPSGISPYSSENQGMFSVASLNTPTDNEQKMINLEETIKSLESKVEKLIKEKE